MQPNVPDEHSQPFDPWEPWSNGPMLRKQCWTARQLYYLTPREIYLESRRAHIGDFPSGYIEQQCRAWLDGIEEVLDQKDQTDGNLSANEDASRQSRVLRIKQALELRRSAEPANIDLLEKRRRLLKQQKLRHAQFTRDMSGLTIDTTHKQSFSIPQAREDTDVDSVSAHSTSTFCTSIHPYNTPNACNPPRKPLKAMTQLLNPDAAVQPIKPKSTAASVISTVPPPSMANSADPFKVRNSRFHHYKPKTNDQVKVYHGKFLVQERKARERFPKVSELDAPLETTLTSRWREYAVLSRLTKDPKRPLVLYFYSCTDHKKLVKKTKRRWRRSLAYKIAIGPEYQMSVYSPLDFTLAVWKPRREDLRKQRKLEKQRARMRAKYLKKYGKYMTNMYSRNTYTASVGKYFRSYPRFFVSNWMRERKQRRRERRVELYANRNTHILLIHAQRLGDILDFAYVVATAVGKAGPLINSHDLRVGIPSSDTMAHIKLPKPFAEKKSLDSILSALEKLVNNREKELVSLKELLSPVSAYSNDVYSLANSLQAIANQVSEKLQVPGPNGGQVKKVSLAWTLSKSILCPLWLPSFTSHLFPVTRIGYLVHRSATLVMVNPEPKCYEGDQLEPVPVEGYCSMATEFGKWGATQSMFFSVENHYLVGLPATSAEPSMLAAAQNDVIKKIEPYQENFEWVTNSTCLRESDFHDVIARRELDRRVSQLGKVTMLFDLLHCDNIGCVPGGSEMEIHYAKQHSLVLRFQSPSEAAAWMSHLESTIKFWQAKQNAELIRMASGLIEDYSITPLLQNRAVVFSGPLFMKHHQYTSFKAYLVLLTPKQLLVFRTSQYRKPARELLDQTPAVGSKQSLYRHIELEGAYVYTGQAAAQQIVKNDNFNDPTNPGVRALPRTYEDGSISNETEQDRCLVVRTPKVTFVFLARNRIVRDRWALAIRYQVSNLQIPDPLESEFINNTDNI